MIRCDVLRPRLSPRLEVLSRFNFTSPHEQSELVCQSVLLAGISPQDCTEILSRAKIREFSRNERLFNQGQPIDELFMIGSGSLKLTQLSSNGREVILWMVRTGDAVGMHADAVGSNHSCSAVAMERCQVFVWEHNLLQVLIARYPQIQINLRRILVSRLCELEERFHELASEGAAKRLALVLLRLLKSIGKESHEGVELELTREELAQMTGTTHFTITRILSKWAEFGLIVPRRDGILISDPDPLRCLEG